MHMHADLPRQLETSSAGIQLLNPPMQKLKPVPKNGVAIFTPTIWPMLSPLMTSLSRVFVLMMSVLDSAWTPSIPHYMATHMHALACRGMRWRAINDRQAALQRLPGLPGHSLHKQLHAQDRMRQPHCTWTAHLRFAAQAGLARVAGALLRRPSGQLRAETHACGGLIRWRLCVHLHAGRLVAMPSLDTILCLTVTAWQTAWLAALQ